MGLRIQKTMKREMPKRTLFIIALLSVYSVVITLIYLFNNQFQIDNSDLSYRRGYRYIVNNKGQPAISAIVTLLDKKTGMVFYSLKTDPEGRFELFSDKYKHLLGLPRMEFLLTINYHGYADTIPCLIFRSNTGLKFRLYNDIQDTIRLDYPSKPLRGGTP